MVAAHFCLLLSLLYPTIVSAAAAVAVVAVVVGDLVWVCCWLVQGCQLFAENLVDLSQDCCLVGLSYRIQPWNGMSLGRMLGYLGSKGHFRIRW